MLKVEPDLAVGVVGAEAVRLNAVLAEGPAQSTLALLANVFAELEVCRKSSRGRAKDSRNQENRARVNRANVTTKGTICRRQNRPLLTTA